MNRSPTTLNHALAPLLIPVFTLLLFWIGDRNVYPMCMRLKDLADRVVACPLVLPTPFAIVAFLIALAGLTSSALRLYRYYSNKTAQDRHSRVTIE